MKIKTIEGEFAHVQTAGITRKISIQLLSGVKTGDYVLVHAGFAIEKLDPAQARETLKIIHEIH